MKMIILDVILLIVALFSMSCNNITLKKSANHLEMDFLNDEIQAIIYDYMAKYSEIDSFVLITDWRNKRVEKHLDTPQMMILGPFYLDLFDRGEDSFVRFPALCLKNDNKIIYIQSSVDIIANRTITKSFDTNRVYIPSSKEYGNLRSFFSKAIVIAVSKSTAEVISHQADTLLLKKEIPVSVPPIEENTGDDLLKEEL